MNTIPQAYCQFKYDCNSKYPENPFLQKSRGKFAVNYSNHKFYLEEYNDFESLKKRINEIYEYISKAFERQNIDIFGNECAFPEFIICNQYGESLIIGISSFGWKISVTFYSYLIKNFEKRYGKEEGQKRYWQLAKEKEVFFYLDSDSEPNIVPACELVSEETAYIILKEFLDTGKSEWDIEPNIFYQEIQKRNY